MFYTKHYVEFSSPGTLFAAQRRQPIDSWSTEIAVKMAALITERHGAKPYGFRFVTMRESDPVKDGDIEMHVESREVDRSGMFYINGTLETIDDIERRADPSDRILLSNMRCNRYPIVVVTTNGYKNTRPFEANDAVVDSTGKIVRYAGNTELLKYRAEALARIDADNEAERKRWEARGVL